MPAIETEPSQHGLLGALRARQANFAMGSVITFGFNGIAFVLYMFGTVLVARALGPTESGHLVWFITGTTTCAVFTDFLGIYYSNAYLIAKAQHGFEIATIRGTVLTYGATLGALAALVFTIPPVQRACGFSAFDSSLGRLLVALNILGLVLVTQIRGLLWGHGSFFLLGLITLIKSGGYGIIAIALVHGLGWRLGAQVALAQVIATWACVAGAIVFFAWRGVARPSTTYLKCCLQVGWRGAGVYFASFLHLRFDQFLVNSMLGATALGLYGVVTSLGEFLVQGPTMLGSVLFHVVAGDADQVTAAKRTLKRTSVVMLAIAALTLPLAWFAPTIIPLLFGPKFMPSARLLLFFLPGTICLAALVMINSYLAACGYPVLQLKAALAAVGINVACNLILLPRIGVAGAPISNSISSAAWLLMIGSYLARRARASNSPKIARSVGRPG